MSGPNEIVHQTVRLKILAALHAAPRGEMLAFSRLKLLTKATDGNLGRQIAKLREAGYVDVVKDFHKNRPRTRVSLSPAGVVAFEAHVAYLQSLLPGLDD